MLLKLSNSRSSSDLFSYIKNMILHNTCQPLCLIKDESHILYFFVSLKIDYFQLWFHCKIDLRIFASDKMKKMSNVIFGYTSTDVFFLVDATDRSKISSDQKRFFIAFSLYPLLFFTNTPFKGDCCESNILLCKLTITIYPRTSETSKEFIKCRFLNLLIMENCRYLALNLIIISLPVHPVGLSQKHLHLK